MKVTMISGSMPPLKCGVGFYTNRLLDTLGRKHDITLITTKGLNSHPLVKNTVRTDGWRIGRIGRLVKAVKNSEPDVIHIQYPAVGYKRQLGINLLPLALRLSGVRVPIVVTLHEYFGSGFLGKMRNRITVRHATRIFVSNPYDMKALPFSLRRKAVMVPIGSNIRVARRGVKKYEALLKTAGYYDQKPVIFLGFPFANKGIETLIDAAHIGRFGVLFLCGFDKNDPYQQKLLGKINYARSFGVHLYVAGYLDDESVSQILQESEVFALPSPLPLTAKSGTAIAAVVHGLVVVSEAAKTLDMNLPYVNEENAVLLRNMNPVNLSAAIVSTVNNRPKYKYLKENSLKLASYFSWESIAELHGKNYKELKK